MQRSVFKHEMKAQRESAHGTGAGCGRRWVRLVLHVHACLHVRAARVGCEEANPPEGISHLPGCPEGRGSTQKI